MTILIVEDDEALLEFYKEIFAGTVFEIVTARNLIEASEKLNNQVFYAIIFDYLFKTKTSQHLIERLRHRPDHPNHRTPILVVSGNLDGDGAKALAPHVEKIILKPFSAKYLLQEVQLLAELDWIEKRKNVARKILVVEDDEDFRLMVCEWLNQNGYCAIGAGNHIAAHKLVMSERYDCILLDLNLDGVDGQSIILGVRLQEEQINKETPFVIMSGDLQPDEIPEFRNLAHQVLLKPFSLKALPKIIESAMAQQKKESA